MRVIKGMKKLGVVLALSLSVSMVAPSCLPVITQTSEAATKVKLSKSKLTLEAGKTYTLKLSGKKKGVKWTSSKKSVATVSKTGKVTAKKAGTAKITATVNKKKYNCKVTVKAKKEVNNDKTIKMGKMTFENAANWKTAENSIENTKIFYSKEVDSLANANSVIIVQKTDGTETVTYDIFKEYIDTTIAEQEKSGSLKGGKTEDMTSKAGIKMCKITGYQEEAGKKYSLEQYAFAFDKSMFVFAMTAEGDSISAEDSKVLNDMIDSVKVAK